MVYQCGLRLAERFKSGGPSLGRSPGAHKQRRPVNQKQIQIFGEIGSTQFLEQGFVPCSFFLVEQGLASCSFSFRNAFPPASRSRCLPIVIRDVVRRKLLDLPDWRGGLRRRATGHRGHVSIFLVCKQHGHAAFRTCVHRAAAKHKPLHALPERTQ